MNNTIDFNTAKTIDTMSKKIDHIDDTVSGFSLLCTWSCRTNLAMQSRTLQQFLRSGFDCDPPDDAPHILFCFDEADEGIGISGR